MEFNPLTQPHNWTFRQVVWATLVLVFVVLGFWLLYRFYLVVFTLFIAILIGTVIRPVVNWLYRRGFSRMTGVILVYVSGACPADRFWFVVISLTDRPGYNDCRSSAGLLPEPANVDIFFSKPMDCGT